VMGCVDVRTSGLRMRRRRGCPFPTG
jgi:hypothetical protein